MDAATYAVVTVAFACVLVGACGGAVYLVVAVVRGVLLWRAAGRGRRIFAAWADGEITGAEAALALRGVAGELRDIRRTWGGEVGQRRRELAS